MKLNKKNKIGLLVLVLGLYVVYITSVKKTTHMYTKFQKESILQQELEGLSSSRYLFLQKDKAYDSILAIKNFRGAESLENYLFNNIQRISNDNKVAIVKYHSPYTLQLDTKSVQASYLVEMKGDFKNLLNAIHQIEGLNMGSIVSLKFETKRNTKTYAKELHASFVLQNIE